MRMESVGSSSANFENEFTSAGINQTKHQIVLNIDVAETMRFTMLETRVVARLTRMGRIWVVAKITAAIAAAMAEKARTASKFRRAIRRR